jgi:hypothetical protein
MPNEDVQAAFFRTGKPVSKRPFVCCVRLLIVENENDYTEHTEPELVEMFGRMDPRYAPDECGRLGRPAPSARRYPDDFVAGRSPVVAMIMVRIDQAIADGRLGDKPALEVALALSALGQGLVSMQRANRFSSEKQFKALFRTALRHCLESFSAKPAGRAK